MREFVPRPRSYVVVSAFVVGACIAVPTTGAQIAPRLDLGGAIEVGGESERYLRMLQLTGTVPVSPWTALPFAGSAERSLLPRGPHPWQSRFLATTPDSDAFQWLRPTASTTVNTTFPYQGAAGPVWTGRGATAAIQGGMAGRWGRVSLQLAPIAFIAQNAAFVLAPNGATGDARFGDARFPFNIDYPQRFGESAYGRLDLGSSSVALDLGAVSAGVSNAPQRWGPAREYPLVLGPGAGGFPHAFVGTAAPIDIRIAHVQARLIAGTLAQSAFSPAPADRSQRVASAAVVGISPRGLDGLELGFARFFSSTEPATIRQILRPLSLRGLVGAIGDTITDNLPNENQIASAFFRWALPKAGVEVYGEWYREDFPGDLRKLLIKPDDLSSFMVGFQRMLVASPRRHRVARFEIVNGELSHQERGQRGFAAPFPPYLHFQVLQGHTQRGLPLGSPEAYGGAGWRAALDDYTERGRVTVALERALRFDWLPGQPTTATRVRPNVLYGVRLEMLRFVGRRDYTVTLVPAIDLNRNLLPGVERFNLHAAARVRGW